MEPDGSVPGIGNDVDLGLVGDDGRPADHIVPDPHLPEG